MTRFCSKKSNQQTTIISRKHKTIETITLNLIKDFSNEYKISRATMLNMARYFSQNPETLRVKMWIITGFFE